MFEKYEYSDWNKPFYSFLLYINKTEDLKKIYADYQTNEGK